MSKFKTKSGVTLDYVDEGEGKPIIFVHGMVCSKAFFQKQIPYFSKNNYRALAVDLRGHGESEKPMSGYTIKTFASDLHELVQALGLKKPILVGWSMGSMVVWEYAAMFPDELGALICVDQGASDFAWPGWQYGVMTIQDLRDMAAALQTDRKPMYQELIQLMLHVPQKEESEFFLGEMMKIPPVIAEAIIMNQTFEDYRESVKGIRVPTLILFGEDPKLNPPEAGYWLHDQIPGSLIKTFKNSSHCPFWEESELFNQTVKEFADSLSAQ